MPAIAPPPEPIAIVSGHGGLNFGNQEFVEGREGRLVEGNRRSVFRAWHGRSEFLTHRRDIPDDELPAVYQSPIVRTVNTTFYDAGRHLPLPFPDSDD